MNSQTTAAVAFLVFLLAGLALALSGCTTTQDEHRSHHWRISEGCKQAYRRGETQYADADAMTHLCPIDHLQFEEGR